MPSHETVPFLPIKRQVEHELIGSLTPDAAVAAAQFQIAQPRHVASADNRQFSWAQDRAVIARSATDAKQPAGRPDGVKVVGHDVRRAGGCCP